MAGTFQPIRRSPIHHVHEHHNAQFTEQDGWQVVKSFTGAESELQSVRGSVGVCDHSPCGKIEIKGKEAASFVKGLTLSRAKAYRIHDQHFIVIAEPAAVESTTKQLVQAAAGKTNVYVIPNSSAYASF